MPNTKNFNLGHLIEQVGDGEDLTRMLAIFADSTPKILIELNNSYNDSNFDGIAASAHKLKATIDILRIEKLQGVVREIDRISSVQENQDKLPHFISNINDVMKQVFAEINDAYLSDNKV